MWSQRDPGLRKSGVGNIFIKNLDRTIDNKVMYDTFSTFGNILSCKVAQDEEGKSRGYGFVHFETEEAANNAIDKVNNMLLNDKQVYVGRFLPRKDREKMVGEHAKKFKNVFVKNFGDEIPDDEKLKETFEKYGKIVSAKVACEEEGKSKGFGFVAFENAEDAEKAVEEMNNKELHGRILYVGRAQKKIERQAELRKKFEEQKAQRLNKYTGVNLYVKNLDDQIDDERLRKEFQVFGTITSAKVMTDTNGRSRGFGFVCFSEADEATKAVTDMNGKIVVAKPLYVAIAQRKDDRRAHLLTQQYHRASQMQTRGPQAPAAGPGHLHHHHPGHAQMAPAQMMGQPSMNPLAVPGGGPGVGPGPNSYMMGPNFAPYQKFPYAGHPQHAMQARPPRWQAGAMPQMQRGPPYLMRPNTGPRPAGPGQRPQAQTPGRPIVAQQTRPATRHMQPAVAGGRPGVQAPAPPVPYKYAAGYIQQQPPPPYGNQMVSGAPAQPPSQMVNSVQVQGHEPLTAKMLAEADPSMQKDMLGERIYPLINPIYAAEAGKITGMLLEMDNADLLHLLEDHASLQVKVEEAVSVLHSQQIPKQA